jgi:AAA domain
MKLEQASRKRVKLRLNIASPSGFGKTYSALLIAFGITGNWQSIAVIDSENDSASLYSHLGEYKTLKLDPPYSPERYIKAIKICEDAGIQVLIIDSVTHIWKGQGGLLEYQNALGGRYQDWAKATPLYQQWLNAILQSKCHIITTNRKKQGYNMITEGNKTKVEKAGLDDEIRDGYEYEMTVALEIINDKHMARASKDRTQLFVDKPEFVISVETGKAILDWCNQGIEPLSIQDEIAMNTDEIIKRVEACKTVNELIGLYKLYPKYQESLLHQFTAKRQLLENRTINNTQNINHNGTPINK